MVEVRDRVGVSVRIRVRVSDNVYAVWCKNQGDSNLSQHACGLQMTEEDYSLRDLSSLDDLPDK